MSVTMTVSDHYVFLECLPMHLHAQEEHQVQSDERVVRVLIV